MTGASAGLALTALGGPARAFAQDGDKPTIKIGSKSFTEQNIMGDALGLLLEDAGFSTELNLNLGGTAIAHEGLLSGDIDTYVEYTGTALVAILGMDMPEKDVESDTKETEAGMDPAYQAVAERYPEEFEVQWLKPWGFNNTYGLAVLPETAEKYDLKTFSDLEAVASELILGTDQEFPIREDGLPAFEDEYGFSFGDVTSGDIGLMFSALINGEVTILNSYATDGRIPAYDLVLLEDDRNFFPPYYAAPIVRQDALEANPELEEILNQPAGKIDNLKMAEINNLVDGQGVEPRDAAQQLLEDIGVL